MSTSPIKLHCLADICLIPIGTATPSVSKYVALVEKHIRAQDHLTSHLHSAGTTISGPWDEVMHLVGELHQLCHDNGVLRVQSDIRVGTRTDKDQTMADKVDVVEERLKNDRFD